MVSVPSEQYIHSQEHFFSNTLDCKHTPSTPLTDTPLYLELYLLRLRCSEALSVKWKERTRERERFKEMQRQTIHWTMSVEETEHGL